MQDEYFALVKKKNKNKSHNHVGRKILSNWLTFWFQMFDFKRYLLIPIQKFLRRCLISAKSLNSDVSEAAHCFSSLESHISFLFFYLFFTF